MHFLVKCRFASLWRISRALSSLKCVHFVLGNQIYIRLIALLRILSCFLEASAALLGQVQVCILLWRISRALSSLKCVHFVLDKQIPWHPPDCFAQDSELLFGQCRTSRPSAGLHPSGASAEPCRALNVSVFSTNKYSGTSG